MKIGILNHQRVRRPNRDRIRALLRHLVRDMARSAPHLRWTAIDILLTDDAGIRPVKLTCFGRSEATDVISLPYAAFPGEDGVTGDIVLNVQRAVEESRRRRCPVSEELALYLAHGCNHLIGETDETVPARRRMRRRERRWLSGAAALGFTRRLVRPDNPGPDPK